MAYNLFKTRNRDKHNSPRGAVFIIFTDQENSKQPVSKTRSSHVQVMRGESTRHSFIPKNGFISSDASKKNPSNSRPFRLIFAHLLPQETL